MFKIMKKYFYYVALFMSMFLLTACPSADEDEKESSNLFIGYWLGSKNIFLYEDGVMLTGNKYNSNVTPSKWSYSDETKLLSTTSNGLQWEITLTDPSAWSGLDLGNNGKAVSFIRAGLDKTIDFILEGDWENYDEPFVYNNKTYYDRINISRFKSGPYTEYGVSILTGGGSKIHSYSSYIEEKVVESKNQIEIYFEKSKKTSKKGYIKICNPYSYYDVHLEVCFYDLSKGTPGNWVEVPFYNADLKRE